MKYYNLEATADPRLLRIVDPKGDWTHYFYVPLKKALRAVNYILSDGYNKGPGFLQALKKTTPEEWDKKLKAGGDRGDAIHQFVKMIFDSRGQGMDMNTPVLAEDNITHRRLTFSEWQAVIAFQTFWQRHNPLLLSYEKPVFNLKLGYAGTFDFIAKLRAKCSVRSCDCAGLIGQVVLFDLKSGTGIYDDYGPQTAAYAHGDNILEHTGGYNVQQTAIIRVGTNHVMTGGYQLEVYDYAETAAHWKEFQAAITIADGRYKEFDLDKDNEDIPDTLSINIDISEEKAKVARKAKKPSGNRKAKISKTA